jgi:hypothetical protein
LEDNKINLSNKIFILEHHSWYGSSGSGKPDIIGEVLLVILLFGYVYITVPYKMDTWSYISS